jgi:hypothetical protein
MKDFPLHEHMLASTNSNKEGIFEIRFKESDFMHLFKRQPHVYFEIIDTNKSFQYVIV